MSTISWAKDELLEVLACDIDARPDAPGVDALAPYVRAAVRTATELVLHIDAAGLETARAFVAAECVCCSTIGWKLSEGPAPGLRITATEPQIDALTALVPPTILIETVQ